MFLKTYKIARENETGFTNRNAEWIARVRQLTALNYPLQKGKLKC